MNHYPKKLVALTIALFAICFCELPTDAKDTTTLKQIKNRYSEVSEMAKSEYTGHTAINISHILPGSGPHQEKVDLYYNYNDKAMQTRDIITFNVYLIRVSYNIAAHNFYEEYVFDDNQTLIFHFLSADSYEIDGKEEYRYYLSQSGVPVYANKKTILSDKTSTVIDLNNSMVAKSCRGHVSFYLNLFDNLVNKNVSWN